MEGIEDKETVVKGNQKDNEQDSILKTQESIVEEMAIDGICGVCWRILKMALHKTDGFCIKLIRRLFIEFWIHLFPHDEIRTDGDR